MKTVQQVRDKLDKLIRRINTMPGTGGTQEVRALPATQVTDQIPTTNPTEIRPIRDTRQIIRRWVTIRDVDNGFVVTAENSRGQRKEFVFNTVAKACKLVNLIFTSNIAVEDL